MFFKIGDYLAGMTVGVLTALAVRATVGHGVDMVLAMVLGMVMGVGIHLLLGLLLSPLLGMFHTMIPGSLVGMYGGMYFAMRDSMDMAPATSSGAAWVGAAVGALVVFGVNVYDRVLRGAVIDTEPENG